MSSAPSRGLPPTDSAPVRNRGEPDGYEGRDVRGVQHPIAVEVALETAAVQAAEPDVDEGRDIGGLNHAVAIPIGPARGRARDLEQAVAGRRAGAADPDQVDAPG